MHVVVVGSGLGGLLAALRLASPGVGRARVEVTVVTKTRLGEANTAYAQGGVAGVMWTGPDSVEAHVADTIAAGAGLSAREAVEVLCTEGPAALRSLIELGVRFDRMPDGSLARGLEAAHSAPRILHAGGDATGAEIERALVDAVTAHPGIRIVEDTAVAELLLRSGAVTGVLLATGEALEADAVLLASGGAGQLFAHTTNPAVATGDGVAAAWRAGAMLADAEFYQFHPTALAADVPGSGAGAFLVSEAVRGEGAVLRDASGSRFMAELDPRGELAPRDVVARGIAARMAAQNGEPVVLDATALGAARLAERFPTIDRAVRAAGLDWARTPIPVTPAAHYWMGGVATDLAGRASLPGLWAAGEAASTGVHGANRLASNSLLEAAVFARRAASDITATLAGRRADERAGAASAVPFPATSPPWSAVASRATADDRPEGPRPSVLEDSAQGAGFSRAALQRLMWARAGVARDGEGLREAAATLAGWDAGSTDTTSLEDRNLLELGRVVVAAALDREESRGAHFRTDFPTPRAEYAARGMRSRDTDPTTATSPASAPSSRGA